MPQTNRLISLDAFRGMTIALMILVNNPGSWSHVYAPLRHAKWHGLTPTDLVFPFFLFIMGVAMAWSFARYADTEHPRRALYLRIIRRTAILILLGWAGDLFPRFDFSTMRIPGVLVRIGVCYFFASLIILNSSRKGLYAWTGGLLLLYWIMMVAIPFPGKGADPWAFGSNFAQYIDNLLLAGHMWKPDFDPEGIISTIPAISTVLFGYLTGLWLRSERREWHKLAMLFIAGNILILLALMWKPLMPINKQLWTGSYVLITAGLALHGVAMSYWFVDMLGQRKWVHPFVIFGSNSLFVYVASGLMVNLLFQIQVTSPAGGSISLPGYIYRYLLAPTFGDTFGSLVYPMILLLFWLAVLAWMYKRKIFIKI